MSLADSLSEAQADIDRLLAEAAAAGITLRTPPEQLDPRSCCGRGCHPCMFTYYFDALALWRAEAGQRLTGA